MKTGPRVTESVPWTPFAWRLLKYISRERFSRRIKENTLKTAVENK